MDIKIFKSLQALSAVELEQQQNHYVSDDIPPAAIDLKASHEYKVPVINNDYFFRNCSVAIRKHNRFAPYPVHTHQFFEINYMLRGHATEYVNDHKVVLNEGDVLLLDIGSQHRIDALGTNDLLINVLFRDRNISLDLISQIQAAKSVLYDFLINNMATNPKKGQYILFKNFGSGNNEIQATFDALITEYYHQRDFADTIIKSQLTILIVQLVRNNRIPVTTTSPTQKLAIDLLDEIRQHYQEISLEALSNKYSYNKNYLSNLFHKVVGKTFSEALTEERLIHARESIQHTARPITVICHEVGFSNKSFFYHKYAEKFGCTPKEDRQLGKQQFLTASL
ncbi:helix-turn-helix domain-containing protein [Loigolactobacillus coryniformis]|uniref:AraC family transcriptional regulator n=1 Tax=Loigolactobacillus coryniformis TaxID=1610 RepID=UPI00201A59B4|nr:helix-turn-helix domain-containing protein [Loigolactobacillus coryniformis]MCL5459375.1 helix-turn-helix domain-containing protein [Loigolactobacillus coryniformis]